MTTFKPQALSVLYTINDVRNASKLTRTAAIEAYQLFDARKWVVPDTVDFFGGQAFNRDGVLLGNLGDPGLCYATSAHMARLMGGSVCYGWLVDDMNRIGIRTGDNEYADCSLLAHATWKRPDGTICEVTRIADIIGNLRFIPHERVKDGCQVGILFIDKYGDGKRYQFRFDEKCGAGDGLEMIMEVRL